MKSIVYIITGPPGAGKSTISRKVAEQLPKSACIEGDLINHMIVGGYEPPWLSSFHIDLIWTNIISLTKNYLECKYDVIIDYVTFQDKLDDLIKALTTYDVEVKYVILLVDENELVRRDEQRNPEDQMGERSLVVLHEFLQSMPPRSNILNTTHMEIEKVVEEIIMNKKYIVKN